MFLADSYFEIGSTHTVCEDYSVAGVINQGQDNEIAYSIVSDGCSSAKGTDIGSRILVKIVQLFICSSQTFDLTLENFYEKLLLNLNHKISESIRLLSLDLENFYATLLISISDKENTKIFILGDGVLKIKTKTSSIIKVYEYSANAPNYPIYQYNEDLKDSFMALNQVLKVRTIETNLLGETHEYFETVPSKTVIKYEFRTMDLELVSIMSDGVETYYQEQKDGTQLSLDVLSVMPDLTEYKKYDTVFVSRRLNKYKKDCEKFKVKHKDDVSIASIYFGT